MPVQAILAPDFFQDEAALTEDRCRCREIIERDDRIKIPVGTGLPFEERVYEVRYLDTTYAAVPRSVAVGEQKADN